MADGDNEVNVLLRCGVRGNWIAFSYKAPYTREPRIWICKLCESNFYCLGMLVVEASTYACGCYIRIRETKKTFKDRRTSCTSSVGEI